MEILPHRMPHNSVARVAFVACAILAVACGDPTRQQATYTNGLQSFSVYTLTGAPPGVPNALSFFGGVVRANSTFGFDVAFELDAAGKIVVYPVRALSGSLAGIPKRVGLLYVPGGFGALTEVPASGYDTVSVQNVPVGATFAVEIRDLSTCYTVSILSPVAAQFIYAKFVIDSVHVDERRLYGRTVIDPNCGYRGVVPDSIPKN